MFPILHFSNIMGKADCEFKVDITATVTHLGDEEYRND
jgi:hypothetical protein